MYAVGYGAVALLFAAAGVALLAAAAMLLWEGVTSIFATAGTESVIQAIGPLAIALVAIEFSQTILEEEILREANVSAPTRARRFLSRFLVVVVVALAIETLVATFTLLHEDPTKVPYAAAIGGAAALLLAAWGVFIKLNRAAEELEPEAMEEAKLENKKM